MNRRLSRIFLLSFLTLFLPVGLVSAKESWSEFVAAESSLQVQETRLAELASSLEEWLSGRRSKAQLEKVFESVKKRAKSQPTAGLPKPLLSALSQGESTLLTLMENFAALESPDAKGQRVLFSALSEENEKRTLELLVWRRKTIQGLKANTPKGKGRAYLDWESAWHPLWVEEAELTRRLQQGTLKDSLDADSKRKILKGLLRLRLSADKISSPKEYEALHKLSQERLIVLARTAEQLLRIEVRQSRGALTKVRRLSRKLNTLTQDFQSRRLSTLKSLQ